MDGDDYGPSASFPCRTAQRRAAPLDALLRCRLDALQTLDSCQGEFRLVGRTVLGPVRNADVQSSQDTFIGGQRGGRAAPLVVGSTLCAIFARASRNDRRPSP